MTHELEPDLTSPDQVSRANVIADAINRACVDKVRQAVKPKQVQDECRTRTVFAITECQDCGEDIPHATLVATGAVMCALCLLILEQKEKIYAK